jgi:Zn-dependent alcohol dehydrogenase
MKAAIFLGPHLRLATEQVDIDKPIEHKVVVKVVASGVCHSEVQIANVSAYRAIKACEVARQVLLFK